jgi:hypothetical protein
MTMHIGSDIAVARPQQWLVRISAISQSELQTAECKQSPPSCDILVSLVMVAKHNQTISNLR